MQRLINFIIIAAFFIVAVLIAGSSSGCVSANQAIELETTANCPLMKNLMDNEEDLSSMEDGAGLGGDAASCPT